MSEENDIIENKDSSTEDLPEQEKQPVDQTELEDTSGQDYHRTYHISGMYKSWFLDYASYVILERAVPELLDGLKPVQRRILHSMDDLDDGRYNKVANIIGHTMKYHPHGDASIGDALVQLGQKDLLIDTQGNWGNIYTGDSAAAPRYIEARLSKFAREVLFNSKTTEWKLSYDGRNKEPIALPVKFPLLLAQGVEGIAVGLASKILPHNFIELIDASVNYLRGKDFSLLPDFPTGGFMDASKYNNGLRGGKIRVRARISQADKKTLVISEIPFGTTTSNLIDSIISANDKGKIKVRKIEDNTAENVEIIVHLAPGISPDQTIDALYAFTDCEVSISPNACVVYNEKPVFMGVKEMLEKSIENTVDLLKLELEIRKSELLEQLHFTSLEKIFIEKRIYRKIEECETWEAVIQTIDAGLQPYKKKFYREITTEDIVKLTEIKIKRISKYDSFKADDIIKGIEEELERVDFNLENLVDYAVEYYKNIKKKYSAGRERKTEIRNFETIEAAAVAAATQKLYVNRAEGFAGTSLKKDEFVCECSDIDDIIVIRADGTFVVTKVADKVFAGKDIIHIDVFKKNDDRTIYNMIYQDGPKGTALAKRFAVMGVTRDKEYDLTKGSKGSKVLYLTVNANGEAETVRVHLRPKPRLKKLNFEFDFSEIAIKGRAAKGNILSKNSVRKIELKQEGISTLGAIDIWFDDSVQRLNMEERGVRLGEFVGDDRIIVFYKAGYYKTYNFDLTNHFDEDILSIQKYESSKVYTTIYYDETLKNYYVKRFEAELSEKQQYFLNENNGSSLVFFSGDALPRVKVIYKKKSKKEPETEEILLADFIAVKGVKAKGKKLHNNPVVKIKPLEPLPEPVDETTEAPQEAPPDDDTFTDENASPNTPSDNVILDRQEQDEDFVQMKLDF